MHYVSALSEEGTKTGSNDVFCTELPDFITFSWLLELVKFKFLWCKNKNRVKL